MITLTPTPCHLKKFVTPVKERLRKRLERDRKRGYPSLEFNYLKLAYARTGNNLLLFDAVIQCKIDDYPVPDWLRDSLCEPFSNTLNLEYSIIQKEKRSTEVVKALGLHVPSGRSKFSQYEQAKKEITVVGYMRMCSSESPSKESPKYLTIEELAKNAIYYFHENLRDLKTDQQHDEYDALVITYSNWYTNKHRK